MKCIDVGRRYVLSLVDAGFIVTLVCCVSWKKRLSFQDQSIPHHSASGKIPVLGRSVWEGGDYADLWSAGSLATSFCWNRQERETTGIHVCLPSPLCDAGVGPWALQGTHRRQFYFCGTACQPPDFFPTGSGTAISLQAVLASSKTCTSRRISSQMESSSILSPPNLLVLLHSC